MADPLEDQAPQDTTVTAPEPAAAPQERPPLPDIYPVTFDKPQLDAFVRSFRTAPQGPSAVIAQTIVEEVSQDAPGIFDYESLKDGTAKWFDYTDVTRNLPPARRALTDDQIINLFAQDTEGNPIEAGTFLEGFQREVAPSTGSMAGFYAGARAGAMASPPHPLAKLGFSLVGGIGGAMAGYKGGEILTDSLIGPERPMLPGQTTAYEMGKTAAGALGWMPLPFMISKNASLGTAQYLENLAAQNISDTPRAIKLVQGVENMTRRMGEAARGAPKEAIILEGIVGTGQTIGAGMAEDRAPGDPWARLAYETVGGVGFNVIGAPTTTLLANAGNIKPILRNLRDNYREGGMGKVLSPVKNARQNQAVGRILEILEAEELRTTQSEGVREAAIEAAQRNGVVDQAELNRIGDEAETARVKQGIDTIIERLAGDDISRMLVDENGRPIPLTAGAKSGSPALLAIEASLEQLGNALGKERAAGSQAAIKALRNVILAMAQTGDQAALQQAADLAESVFSSQLNNRLQTATQNVIQAYQRVGGSGEQSNIALSERLYDIVRNQMNEARTKERALWKAVPEITIKQFVDQDGVVSDTPNFISTFGNLFRDSPKEYREEYTKAMPALVNFVERKAAELGLTGEIRPQSAELRNANNRLRNVNTRLEGTNFEGAVERTYLRMRANGESNRSIIESFRRQADDFRKPREKGDPPKDPRETTYANALDAQADVLAIIEREADDAVDAGAGVTGEVTSKDLTDMRSLALEYGRQFMAAGQPNRARMAFEMADAMMRDLENAPVAPGAENWRVAYDMARAYSRGLNDTFTRAFGGKALETTKQGGDKVAPELMASRLLQGGNDPTYLRVQQINDIGTFALQQGLPDAQGTVATLRGVTEQLLRNARAAAFNPETGQINPDQLGRWIEQNQDVLNLFPALKTDLQDARKANVLLREDTHAARMARAEEQAQASFYDLMNPVIDRETGRRMFGTESPTTAIAKALAPGNKAPIRSLNRYLDVVRNTPDQALRDQAMSGFKSSILEWAATKAGGSHSGTFSPSTLYDAVFRPIKGSDNRVSLMDWMLEKGVMNEAEASNLRTYLTEMVKFEAADVQGDIGELVERAGPIMDFYLSITGSAIGTKMQSAMTGGKSGPGALIAAGRGAETMRNLFADMPAALKTDVMSELMRNPELLAAMMRRPRSEREKTRVFQRAKEILIDLGFRPVDQIAPSVVRETMREREEVPQQPQAPQPVQIPAPAQTRPPLPQQGAMVPPARLPTQGGGAAPSPSPQAAAAPQRPPIQSSGPVDRTRFAALFPEDRDLVGIGSLMGG